MGHFWLLFKTPFLSSTFNFSSHTVTHSLTCAFPEITFSNMMESSQFNTFLFQDIQAVLLVHFLKEIFLVPVVN